MKKRLLFLLACLTSALNVLADVIPQPPVILPWGANQQWSMKYVLQPQDSYSQPSNDGTGKNWTELGYDDSNWETLTGPMANGPSTDYKINQFSVFTWDGENKIFNLRRTFNLGNVNAYGYTFAGYFDDAITVYINGKMVYESDSYHGPETYGIASFHINASDCQVGENQLAIYFYAGSYGRNYLDYALFEGTSYNSGQYDGLEYGGLHYWFNDDGETMRVTGVNEGLQDANVLSSITFKGKTYPVTTIGAVAFSGSKIETITIPSSITRIGDSAFSDCTSLTSITIPESVTSIGEDAFLFCDRLERVDITDLAAWCNINFAGAGYGGQGASPLGYAGKLYLNGSRITALKIPESVTEIKNYAFIGGKFTSLTIPNTVTRIGEAAFKGCSTLRTAEVLNIGSGCSLTTIEHDAFNGCSALQSANFTEYVTKLGEAAFASCGSLTEVILNDNLTEIPTNAFNGCGSITTINIPNRITDIGNSAFEGCGNLSIDLIFPEGLTTIGDYAFREARSQSLYIPSSVISIGGETFTGLSNATSIIVDEDNTKYDSRGYCNALIETRTGKLLAGCRNTIIPDGVTSLERGALGRQPITFVILPNSVETIKENAFIGCSNLKTIVFGSGVTDIGRAIHYSCIPDDIYCYATEVPMADGDAWSWGYSSDPGGTLHVPAESIDDYRSISPWNKFTTIVPITGDEHFGDIDVTIGAAGYATFSNGYTLDFTGIEGLTAYVAKGDKSQLTYETVGAVPAGTGLLLAGEEGTYQVPVIYSAADINDNLLVGTGLKPSTTLEAGDYLLQNDPTDGIGFYQGAGKTLRAGKAYLHVDDASGVKSFSLPEDNATSIQGIEISQANNLGEVNDNAVYNLAGQRVLKPAHGVYVVGGKKIVIK